MTTRSELFAGFCFLMGCFLTYIISRMFRLLPEDDPGFEIGYQHAVDDWRTFRKFDKQYARSDQESERFNDEATIL